MHLLFANSIIKMSPSFHTVLIYFLRSVLNFTTGMFSIRSLTAELSFLFGIMLLNTVFKNTSRGRFLRVAAVLYVLTHLSLIFVLFGVQKGSQTSGFVVILIWTGINGLLYEIKYLPIIGIFLEICPQNLEGFFMSMILLLNNFSKNIAQFLGTLCIYFMGITTTDFTQIYWLVFLNCVVLFAGMMVMVRAHIPEKPSKKTDEQGVSVLENNYLAYINTIDSMYIPKDPNQAEYQQQQVTNKELMSKFQSKEGLEIKTLDSSIN